MRNGPRAKSMESAMNPEGWKFRAKLFAQRFWQPASACMASMPGGFAKIASLSHWELALRTGLATGVLVLVLSFTPLGKLFRNRYGNALVVGCLTALGDAYSHENHYGIPYAEPIVTGMISGLLALATGYLLEDRARRVRAAWARLTG